MLKHMDWVVVCLESEGQVQTNASWALDNKCCSFVSITRRIIEVCNLLSSMVANEMKCEESQVYPCAFAL